MSVMEQFTDVSDFKSNPVEDWDADKKQRHSLRALFIDKIWLMRKIPASILGVS